MLFVVLWMMTWLGNDQFMGLSIGSEKNEVSDQMLLG